MKAIFGDTIDKIFFWESLKILFFVCFLVLSLDLLLNLVKELEDLNNDYSFGKMFKYLFLISLGRLCEILPLCAVISAILTFGFLSDSGELIAAQILGKSLSSSVFNILKPIIIVLFLTLLSFEFFTPTLESAANNLKYKKEEIVKTSQWIQKDNVMANFSFEKSRGSDVILYFLGPDKKLSTIVEAESFEVQEDSWQLNNAFENINKEEFEAFHWKNAPVVGINEKLGLKEMSLSQVFKILTQTGPERERKKISYEFWKKLLEPFSAIAIILLSLSLTIDIIYQSDCLDKDSDTQS